MSDERRITPKPVKTDPVSDPEHLRVYQGILITNNRLDAFLLIAAPNPKAAKEAALAPLEGSGISPDELEWTEIDVLEPKVLYGEVRKPEGDGE